MENEDTRRDPVEVLRHAREYLKTTRGIERFNLSRAAVILDECERKASKCIDYLLNEKIRAKGVYCPCDFHEAEFKAAHFLKSAQNKEKATKRDGKAAASGEDQCDS
jgi:hypothetical protein